MRDEGVFPKIIEVLLRIRLDIWSNYGLLHSEFLLNFFPFEHFDKLIYDHCPSERIVQVVGFWYASVAENILFSFFKFGIL